MVLLPVRSVSSHFGAAPVALWQMPLMDTRSEGLNLMSQAIRSRDTPRIIEACTEAIRMYPGKAADFYLIRASWLRQVDARLALNDLDEHIQSGAGTTESFYNRGNLRYLLSDYWGAFSDFTQAVSLSNENCLAYYGRASTSCELGKLKLAISDYRNVVRLTHANGFELWARCSCGRILASLGKHVLALNDFQALLEDEMWSEGEPTFFDLHLDIAYSFAHLQHAQQALVHLEKAVRALIWWIDSLVSESSVRLRVHALNVFSPLSAQGIEEKRDIIDTNCRTLAAIKDFQLAKQFFDGTPMDNTYDYLQERVEPYLEQFEVFLEVIHRELRMSRL
jgi:tetratricopeptide (TPR) repeat protein